MKTLVKIDRNGTKYYQEECKCYKCNGTGIYKWYGYHYNGTVSEYEGECYDCNGTGKVTVKTKEYTAEHQAKLEAQREAKIAKRQAEFQAQQEAEAKKQAEYEARIKAEKEQSNYIGNIGDKIEMVVTLRFETSFDTQYGLMFIYSFKDEAGNTLVWKTSAVMMLDGYDKNGNNRFVNKGDQIRIKATIKDHNEYREEKQTILTRVKVVEMVKKAEEEA